MYFGRMTLTTLPAICRVEAGGLHLQRNGEIYIASMGSHGNEEGANAITHRSTWRPLRHSSEHLKSTRLLGPRSLGENQPAPSTTSM